MTRIKRTKFSPMPSSKSAYSKSGAYTHPDIPDCRAQWTRKNKPKPFVYRTLTGVVPKKKTFITARMPLYLCAVFSCMLNMAIRLVFPNVKERSPRRYPKDVERIAKATFDGMAEKTPEKVEELSYKYKKVNGAVDFIGVTYNYAQNGYRAALTANGQTTYPLNPTTNTYMFPTAEAAARAWDVEARKINYKNCWHRNFPTTEEEAERKAMGGIQLE